MPLLFISYIFWSTPFNAFHPVWVMCRLEKPACKKNCGHETCKEKNWHIQFNLLCFSEVPGFTSSDKDASKALLLHKQCRLQQVSMGYYKPLSLGCSALTALDICHRMGCLQRESVRLCGFFTDYRRSQDDELGVAWLCNGHQQLRWIHPHWIQRCSLVQQEHNTAPNMSK